MPRPCDNATSPLEVALHPNPLPNVQRETRRTHSGPDQVLEFEEHLPLRLHVKPRFARVTPIE